MFSMSKLLSLSKDLLLKKAIKDVGAYRRRPFLWNLSSPQYSPPLQLCIDPAICTERREQQNPTHRLLNAWAHTQHASDV